MQPRLRATLVIASIAVASGIAGAAIDRTFLVRGGGHRGPPGDGGEVADLRGFEEPVVPLDDLGAPPVAEHLPEGVRHRQAARKMYRP